MYLRIWDYDVPAASLEAFTAAYGPGGDWARLFARAPGYLGTELFAGTGTPTRLLTVDRWVDEAAWAGFLDRWREDYEALDARLEALGALERELLERTSADG